VRLGEIHNFLAGRGDGEVRRRDVALPRRQRGEDLVSTDGDIEELHLEVLALGLPVLVDPLLQLLLDELECVVGDPTLRALVVEIEGLAGHDQDPDDPTLDHLVQIALPGLQDRLRIDGQVFSGSLWGVGGLRGDRDSREQRQRC
jgi:hypothetical protein